MWVVGRCVCTVCMYVYMYVCVCRPGESPRLAPPSRCHGDGLEQVPGRVNNQQVFIGGGKGGGGQERLSASSSGGLLCSSSGLGRSNAGWGGGRKIRLRVFGLGASRDPLSTYSICPIWSPNALCRAVSFSMMTSNLRFTSTVLSI